MASDGIDLLLNICFGANYDPSKTQILDLFVNKAISHLGDAIVQMREKVDFSIKLISFRLFDHFFGTPKTTYQLMINKKNLKFI